MKSQRLNTIVKFIENTDKVADIGCDHAYLSCYVAENKLCKKIIATDINENALKMAKKNIQKKHLEKKIKTYLSDGLKNVQDKDIDTLVISGMGTNTILHIINDAKKFPIKKLILQSNNDLSLLRSELYKKKFYLQEEKVIYEKKHYYVIGLYTKKYQRLCLTEKLYGKYDISNKDYYRYLYNKLTQINKKLKYHKNFKEKINIIYKIIVLKKYL